MIQDPSKDLTLIVYNSPKPPQYLKLNKSLIKALFFIIPVLVILSISISFLYSLTLKKRIVSLRSEVPEEIRLLTVKNNTLTTELAKTKAENKNLVQKISMGSGTESTLSSMGLFTIPVGSQDLRGKELLNIEDIKIDTQSPDAQKSIKLSFNLANNSSNKLSGYINVIQYQGNIIQYYPSYELSQKNLRLEYTQGESFGFSRFRPTTAQFQKLSGLSARYKIFIFSRTGDLIAFKQVGPFNIE